ncbi:biotin transporter BioY [Aeromicrobium sp. CF3.5]|uniref:biotin transporter BioY n=1 Tax=Aeromicrobium sp. CF3.5 TaxID=3373078 RepID=UPI003EE55A6B
MTSTTTPAKRRGLSTTDLSLIATFAALIAVCAVSAALPFGVNGVPITLQLLAVFLTGAALGAVRGFLSVTLYIVAGAAGLPIFAGGQAGLAPFSGPTSGYLLAFPIAALIIGFVAERLAARGVAVTAVVVILGGVIAETVVTLAGAASIAITADLSYAKGVTAALPFVPADLVKLAIAAVVAAAVHRAFPQLMTRRP